MQINLKTWPGGSGGDGVHAVKVQKSFLQNALVSLSSLSDPRGALKSVCLEPRVLSSTAIQAGKPCGNNLCGKLNFIALQTWINRVFKKQTKHKSKTYHVKAEAPIALLMGQVHEDCNWFHFHAQAHKFVFNSAILPTQPTKNCISSKDRASHQNHAFEQCKASNQQKLMIRNQ